MLRLVVSTVVFTVALACSSGCKDQAASASPATPPANDAPRPKIDLGELPPAPTGEITGRLELDPSLTAKVSAGDIIYIMARNPATGVAVAVVRVEAPARFPLEFTLSGGHTMTPGSGLFGKVRLSARVDKDGDPTSKNAGDVVGERAELVDVPATGVVLKLDKVL